MSRIFISVFLAAALAGGILWTPWQQVNANRTYLQAVVISSTAGSVTEAEPPEPSPEVYEKTYTPPADSIEEPAEVEVVTESEIMDEVAEVIASLEEEVVVEEAEVVVVPVVEEHTKIEEESVATPAPQKKVVAPKDKLAVEILWLLNKERADLGYEPLLLDPKLSALAKEHSEDMAQQEYLAHKDKDGCNLTCRITDAGYKALAWAENIVFLENEYLLSTKEEAHEMMESWMGSGGHRKNIENGEYTHVGIGVARSGDRVYVTTDFALPK